MQVRPMPRPSAHIQELICSGDAPSDCAAWNTMTAELAKPTSTVTKPAAMADRDRSRSRARGGDAWDMEMPLDGTG